MLCNIQFAVLEEYRYLLASVLNTRLGAVILVFQVLVREKDTATTLDRESSLGIIKSYGSQGQASSMYLMINAPCV